MENWNQFKVIEDYYNWLTESGLARPFSYKIGVFSKSRFRHQEAVGRSSYRILVSHTCTVSNDSISTVCPGYTAEEFMESVGKLKKGGKPTYLASVEKNAVPRFLALSSDSAWDASRLVFDIGQLYSVSTEALKLEKPIRSLTFPGNVYFSARLSMFLHRDVEARDDRRSV